MTKPEIFLALELVRDTIIQSHVQLNNAMDQLEKLTAAVQRDIAIEADVPPMKSAYEVAMADPALRDIAERNKEHA